MDSFLAAHQSPLALEINWDEHYAKKKKTSTNASPYQQMHVHSHRGKRALRIVGINNTASQCVLVCIVFVCEHFSVLKVVLLVWGALLCC